MIKEQALMSERLDETGICDGDIVEVYPISGRKYEFKLRRTMYDFMSDDIVYRSPCCKRLGRMNYESFHIRLTREENYGKMNRKKTRYRMKVMKGSAVKLNGQWVLEAYIEQRDTLEIGHNKINFISKKLNQKNDKQDLFLDQNKVLIKSSLPILIQGETGVGKTSLARKIHKQSGRSGKFIHLNISSFSENLIESELFGHVKGAFTGAISDKNGAFRDADKGTLFIDEIDSLSIEFQIKLLLFLDDLKIKPVGSTKDIYVNTRLILSSGVNLLNLVKKGKMRKDFFFRISSGQTINLKSLREKPEYITSFCDEFCRKNDVLISSELQSFYESLPWPGNFRQLKGHLDRKLVTNKSNKFDFDKVDEELIVQSSELLEIENQCLNLSLQQVKEAYIKKVYYNSHKSYQVAAKKLNISAKSVKSVITQSCL